MTLKKHGAHRDKGFYKLPENIKNNIIDKHTEHETPIVDSEGWKILKWAAICAGGAVTLILFLLFIL